MILQQDLLQEENHWRDEIKANKVKRHLDQNEIYMYLQENARERRTKLLADYKREGRKVIYDEVEEALYVKHNGINFRIDVKEEEPVRQLKNQAVIDKVLHND